MLGYFCWFDFFSKTCNVKNNAKNGTKNSSKMTLKMASKMAPKIASNDAQNGAEISHRYFTMSILPYFWHILGQISSYDYFFHQIFNKFTKFTTYFSPHKSSKKARRLLETVCRFTSACPKQFNFAIHKLFLLNNLVTCPSILQIVWNLFKNL